MGNYECTISILNDAKVAYTAPNQVRYEAAIELDELWKRLVKRFNEWIGKDRIKDREDLEIFGTLLYSILLPSSPYDIRKHFESDYTLFLRNKSGNDRFRVTLELHRDAQELCTYPWEFLYMPQENGGFFLAGERTELILTRFVPEMPQRIDVKTEEPLRILVIFSHPRELPNIDTSTTRELIARIMELETTGNIEVRFEENPPHSRLYELMNSPDDPHDADRPPNERRTFLPDIIHFIGHGEPGRLALFREPEAIRADEDDPRQGEARQAEWCEAKTITALFANHTPRLVFLHACEGSKPSSLGGFSDLARQLVHAKVPVVVAMQYEITNVDAALFARTFYDQLRNGSPIDEAVRTGREKLGARLGRGGCWNDRSFGTPVVYIQRDGEKELVSRPAPPLSPSPSVLPAATSGKVDCPNPECRGLVTPTSKFCLLCDHEVGPCPACSQEGKYRMMDMNIGKCECGYKIPKRDVTAASAGEEPRVQKKAEPPLASRPSADAASFRG